MDKLRTYAQVGVEGGEQGCADAMHPSFVLFVRNMLTAQGVTVFLGQAEIYHVHDGMVGAHYEIGWFYVTMHEITGMDIFDSRKLFGG